MSFCKKVFLSVCSFAIGLMFSVNAQEEELQNYSMKCFPFPFNGKIITICLKDENEEGEGLFILENLHNSEDESEISIEEDRDKMWIDLEGDLIAPAQIKMFDRRGKVKPICGPAGDTGFIR